MTLSNEAEPIKTSSTGEESRVGGSGSSCPHCGLHDCHVYRTVIDADKNILHRYECEQCRGTFAVLTDRRGEPI